MECRRADRKSYRKSPLSTASSKKLVSTRIAFLPLLLERRLLRIAARARGTAVLKPKFVLKSEP